MNTQARSSSVGVVRKPATRRLPFRTVGAPEALEARTMLSAYTVTSAADDGSVGTLRDAIKQVNLGGFSQIDFAFSSPTTIALGSALDKVTHAVLINGTKDASGNALVTLHGSAGVVNGLVVDASGVVVKGLAIGGFSGAGVVLETVGGDTLQGNYIGLNYSGTLAMPNGTGVSILTGNNMLAGNVISGNFSDGVDLTGDGNKLQGNLIGTDVIGTVALGNGNEGVLVTGATNTLIGGATAGVRNVVSGNGSDGVGFASDTGAGNVLQGNFIGTDVTGLQPLGNGMHGVDVGTIDGLAVSNLMVTANVISGNAGNGVFVKNSSSNTIQGNWIGTDAAGHSGFFDPDAFDFVLGNVGDGVRLLGGSTGNVISGNVISGNQGSGITAIAGVGTSTTIQGNLIGVDVAHASDGNFGTAGVSVRSGSVFASGNTISANNSYGVLLDTTSDPSVFTGNFVGTDASLATGLGNGVDGFMVLSNNNVIGGTAAGAGNVIAYNAAAGVYVYSAHGNAVRGNSIFSNANLGIGLGSETIVLPNNSTSAPASNNNQNYPVITSVTGVVGGSVTVTGTLHGLPGTSYALDFFSNPAADPTNYGQGKTYLGSLAGVTTDAGGNASFTTSFAGVPSGQNIWSATATDPAGNTSEFSMDVAAVVTAPQKSSTSLGVSSSLSPSTFGQSVTFTATVTPAGGSAALGGTISFVVNNTVMKVVTLGGGNSAAWTTSLAPGGSVVTAVYSGDNNYTSSQNSVSQVVNLAATTTGLSSSLNPSAFGQAVTFTATVTPANTAAPLTGTISFVVNNVVMKAVTLSGGNTATWTTTPGTGGTAVVAVYSGDGYYAGSQTSLTQSVKRAGSVTTVNSLVSPSVCGQAVTFKAAVNGQVGGTAVPSGNVTFTDNGVAIGTAMLNASGVASFTCGTLGQGSHKIGVTYSGDSNFDGSSGSVTQTVNAILGTISGHTYLDTTGDGLTADDKPLAGVTVLLFQDKKADGKLNPLDGFSIKTTASDSNGAYAFGNLAAGRYLVVEIVPTGYVRTAPKTAPYYFDVITGGLVIGNNDFDNRKVGRPLPPVIFTHPGNDDHGKKVAKGLHDKSR